MIGFTTGAATGAIVQIVVFRAEALQVSIGAVAGGLLTAVAVYVLSRGVSGGYRLIPTRIGVSAALGALNGLLLVTWTGRSPSPGCCRSPPLSQSAE